MFRSSAPAAAPYQLFLEHNSELRTNTQLVVLENLRHAHPNKYVSFVSTSSCDLEEFAKAGHASLQSISEPAQYAESLAYFAPRSRLSQELGDIARQSIFEKLAYQHDGADLIVYRVEWPRDFGGIERYYYIVADLSDEDPKAPPKQVQTLLAKAGKHTQDLHEEMYVFQSGCWRKDKKMWASVRSATWDDVIVDSDIKKDLIDDVDGFFSSREVYQEYGVPWKRGIIFHGQPGNGKTITIKAILAALAKRDFPIPGLYVKSFADQRRGPEASIDSIFAQARNMSPCALILEDIDSLVEEKVRSYFLNQLDGLDSNDGILIIGSTNNLDKLDPALSKRPSRFDRKYHFKLPNNAQRKRYADYWGAKLTKNPRVDFNDAVAQYVADLSDGFSFAYMKELFVVALLIMAGQRGRRQPTTEEEKEAATGGDTEEPPPPALPTALSDNLLAKLMQRQAKILQNEMASAESTQAAAKPAKDVKEDDSKLAAYQQQLVDLEARNRK